MIVAGGTYREVVLVPDSNDLVGSGVRAAAALRNTSAVTALVTAVDDATTTEAEWVAEALGIEQRTILARSEPVGFSYLTPISSPSINGLGAVAEGRIESTDATTLIFGFVERGELARAIESDTVVIDPQKPRDTDDLNFDGIDARHVVVVANRSETLNLGGRENDLHGAAVNLLSATKASAVVSKSGAAGCVVTWREGAEVRQESVGAIPTSRVWPIGSGDVFSAGLAYALDSGADFVEAARVGSRSAAYWCATRRPDIPLSVLQGTESTTPLDPRPGRVYVAAPFFTTGERWLVETVRDELFALGVSPWSPFHEVGPGEEIAAADLEGLHGSAAVLALLDHSDSGTVFEVGWAIASGIPVVGFGNVVEPEGMKMLGGSGVELHRDLSTACYRAAWAAMGMQVTAGWVTK